MIQWLLVIWICHPSGCGYERIGYYPTQERCMREAGWTGRRTKHPSWKCVMVCCEPHDDEMDNK
jgi:hypothetical protein